MFSKLSLLALFAPLVVGLSLNTPTNAVTEGPINITWTSAPSDKLFSLELVNELFHNSFAIANNVNPALGGITLTLPSVPVGGGYTLEAVDVSNINNVFASSGSFSVGPNPAATVSASGSGSVSRTGSAPPTVSVSSHSAPATSAFGTTVTTPLTAPTGASGSNSGTGAAASSSGTPKPLNNGASTLKMDSNMGMMVVVVLSGIVGAAAFVL